MSVTRWPLAALSGVLLAFCYPMANFSWLAWIILAPFFMSVTRAHSRRQAIFLGWIFALSFFVFSLQFLVHVAFAAWPALALLESLYGLILGLLLFETRRFSSVVLRVLWIVSVWTAVEFLRTEIPVWGFGLNLLGHSQGFQPAMIQIASVGGAYLLSFVMAGVNALIAEAMIQTKNQEPRTKHNGRKWNLLLVLGSCFLVPCVVLIGGHLRLKIADQQSSPTLRLSVIQPNIPQSVKWALMAKQDVIEIHENLTQVAALREPEMIIWPEASFPGYFNADYASASILEKFRAMAIPVLLGSPYWESETRIFNSVMLVDAQAQITARYDKIRLVPFGEYVPWKLILGWLEPLAYTMGVGDFTAGKSQTLFRLAEHAFAVLICFEDVFPDLARTAVKKGAHFLTVVTNDAWFGKTGAPWQHFQTSIFRAVENGVPVVRSGNTGVSGFISAEGRVLGVVKDKLGESRFVNGELTMELPMAKHLTLYQKGGYLFPYACLIILVVLFLTGRKK
ncbi:MAG TPA: apolipoprotein N-acyltransferase [Candidatus Omnitrophica bacterium]|nr:apolipoprotein N-acyltransferase [Candidatus Omnitrophota bacterium]